MSPGGVEMTAAFLVLPATRREKWLVGPGLALALCGGLYGVWASRQLASTSSPAGAFDRPVARLAISLAGGADPAERVQPRTAAERRLLERLRHERFIVLQLTVFVFRLLLASAVLTPGLILLASGAAEWQLRSRLAGEPRRDPPHGPPFDAPR